MHHAVMRSCLRLRRTRIGRRLVLWLGAAAVAAAIAGLTDGFARYPSTVMAGREFMFVVTLASSVLLYVLGRRLEFRRTAAAVTVVLFGLSPLAVYYHRMVSLDNIGTLWLLAAMVTATARRRNLAAAFWSGVFSTVAVLSKETLGLLLPVVFRIIWQQAQRHTRKWHLAIYVATVALFTAFYPLYAALRGELFPGSGHVSLAWAMWWQLAERTGSGFIFSGGTAAHGLLIQVVMAMTGGYLPFFYVTAMISFAALPAGRRSIGYIVMSGQLSSQPGQLSLLRQALNHSVPIANFDGIVVRRVIT